MARLKLGELIDQSLSVREQARLLTRMRDMLHTEEARQKSERRAGRLRRLLQPNAVAIKRAKAKRDKRLLTVLHTSADPDAIAAARRELTAATAQPQHEDQPSGTAQDQESRPAARVSHHTPGRAPFWAKLGPAPVCAPGDTTTAMVFYRKVTRLLEGGGWSPSERAALHDLAHKWGPRALGGDARFNLVGTVGGRLPRALEQKIQDQRKREP